MGKRNDPWELVKTWMFAGLVGFLAGVVIVAQVFIPSRERSFKANLSEQQQRSILAMESRYHDLAESWKKLNSKPPLGSEDPISGFLSRLSEAESPARRLHRIAAKLVRQPSRQSQASPPPAMNRMLLALSHPAKQEAKREIKEAWEEAKRDAELAEQDIKRDAERAAQDVKHDARVSNEEKAREAAQQLRDQQQRLRDDQQREREERQHRCG